MVFWIEDHFKSTDKIKNVQKIFLLRFFEITIFTSQELKVYHLFSSTWTGIDFTNPIQAGDRRFGVDLSKYFTFKKNT